MLRKLGGGALIALVWFLGGCSGDDGGGCGKIKSATFFARPTAIDLSFETTADANSYRIEYGPTGFTPGSGQSMTTSTSYVTVSGLTPSTTYDVYVTSICSAESTSKPYELSSITTNPSECTGTASVSVTQYSTTTASLYFSYTNSQPNHYELEYGLQGFTRGTGTRLSTTGSDYTIDLSNLQTSTAYDFYIRAVCYDTDGTPWTKVPYTTVASCPQPTNLNSYNISGACNSGNGETRGFTWSYEFGQPTSYTISVVSASGVNNPAGGTTFTTSNPSIALSGMYCNWDAFFVRANCGNGESSAWAGPFYF
ncbi:MULTISPECIES: fibronectin type III domain-containing protein [unclassified Flavobacterium]|uniref:fibronectin type III domain-containing protein n=1 Tax=unclassified Flavobacterium TaxID=196869 RepID=UPI001F12B64C|nr:MULTISPECIES: fibronectin type III domain-containing protein [unclassified Flavobacterium]UMY64685.1 fibronectin type III domain-containing protein [Flavobacterium sp. HJ-32-4]